MFKHDQGKQVLLGTLAITGSINTRQIEVSSADCDPKVSICGISLPLRNFSSPLQCELQFAGSMVGHTRNTLTCNEQVVDLDEGGVVVSLVDAVDHVHQVSVEGVESYSLTCPGLLTLMFKNCESNPGLANAVSII